MTVSTGNDVHYDPYDVELNADPTRADAALVDHQTFSSARGAVQTVHATNAMMPIVGAANREPRRFGQDSETFNIHRDLTNAELSPTSTARGWESMPAVLS